MMAWLRKKKGRARNFTIAADLRTLVQIGL
jgi:hypothetical protein